MKVLVLGGSPKGNNSVTMSYVRYLQTAYLEHSFAIKEVALSISRLEKDPVAFEALIQEVRECDVVLWAFPLYFMLVHSNYKRFIELIFERNVMDAFQGKYTASLSTSIHYFDHTAHNYIQAICDDLRMNYAGFYSPEMNDLMDPKKRKDLENFFEDLVEVASSKGHLNPTFAPIVQTTPPYEPGNITEKVDLRGQKLILVTDEYHAENPSTNLDKMILQFKNSFTTEIDILDISQIKISGGCLGCLHCGFDNICEYDGKDDVRDTYENRIKVADIIVLAGTLRDRYLSSLWKKFIDRRFYNTHQPAYVGKQMACLVSGALSQNQNLRQILTTQVEMDQANLVDIVTDEVDSSSYLDQRINFLARRLVHHAEMGTTTKETFLGVAGTKLFRDEMYGHLRFMFQKDYQYYKKHGMMDFPQYDIKTRLMNLAIPLTKIKSIKKMIQSKTKDMMHMSHDHVVKAKASKQ